MKKDKIKKEKVYAYGFDEKGFDAPNGHIVDTNQFEIKFVSVDSTTSLDEADGVIFPSGLFEKFSKQSNYSGTFVDVHCKRDLLLQRDRELLNLYGRGGWICCLIEKIIDEVEWGDYRTKKCADTDLSKTILNAFDIKRHPFKGSAGVSSKNDEFTAYIKQWGVAKTTLELSYKDQDRKVLATTGSSVVGVEFYGRIFILPVHSTRENRDTVETLAKEISKSIHDYSQKRISTVPDWATAFKFKKEKELHKKLDELLTEASSIQKTIHEIQSYKGILSQSGDALKDNVVFIVKKVFNLKVTDVEDFKEDAIIRGKKNEVLVVVEVKGTKGGVKRKYINQLDSNRERIDVPSSVPGLLVVNDQMGIEDIAKRKETTVADEQIKHAKNMNILILRTIDLLYLMRNLEGDDQAGKALLDFCNNGGGQLVATTKTQKIIT